MVLKKVKLSLLVFFTSVITINTFSMEKGQFKTKETIEDLKKVIKRYNKNRATALNVLDTYYKIANKSRAQAMLQKMSLSLDKLRSEAKRDYLAKAKPSKYKVIPKKTKPSTKLRLTKPILPLAPRIKGSPKAIIPKEIPFAIIPEQKQKPAPSLRLRPLPAEVIEQESPRQLSPRARYLTSPPPPKPSELSITKSPALSLRRQERKSLLAPDPSLRVMPKTTVEIIEQAPNGLREEISPSQRTAPSLRRPLPLPPKQDVSRKEEALVKQESPTQRPEKSEKIEQDVSFIIDVSDRPYVQLQHNDKILDLAEPQAQDIIGRLDENSINKLRHQIQTDLKTEDEEFRVVRKFAYVITKAKFREADTAALNLTRIILPVAQRYHGVEADTYRNVFLRTLAASQALPEVKESIDEVPQPVLEKPSEDIEADNDSLEFITFR